MTKIGEAAIAVSDFVAQASVILEQVVQDGLEMEFTIGKTELPFKIKIKIASKEDEP